MISTRKRFKVPTDKYNDTELQKELSNGRLAMLGTLGYMAQELIQQHPIV
jgi:Chlorophyll A-B binding protein.